MFSMLRNCERAPCASIFLVCEIMQTFATIQYNIYVCNCTLHNIYNCNCKYWSILQNLSDQKVNAESWNCEVLCVPPIFWFARQCKHLHLYNTIYTFETVQYIHLFGLLYSAKLGVVKCSLCASKDMTCNSLPVLCVCSTILHISNLAKLVIEVIHAERGKLLINRI